MDRMVLLLLSLIWVMGVTSSLRTLVYVSDSRTWAEAQAYCRQHHTDLVTIRTDLDNNNIRQDSWLGLRRESSTADWKWSGGDEALTYDAVWKDPPDEGKDCVLKEIGDGGKWRSKDCGENRKFFCVDELLSLVKERKTWEEALAHCRAKEVIDPTVHNNHSYDLASLMTPEDHKIAREMIQAAETEQVWTGLRFLGDQWMWISGEEVQYGDINSCPGVNRCGALDKASTQLYSIRGCAERKNFLCYKRPTVV